MKVSVLIPVYNEEESLQLLYDELVEVVEGQSWEAEFVFVDDGSSDGSAALLGKLADGDARCKVVRFTRNFGQTAGILAGIDHANGDVLVPMDADLQNDPRDIPALIAKLAEGYDVVSGWRKDRQDKFLTRRLPSLLANRLISRWTGVRIHDYGCTLKAYRAGVLKGVELYGEMHRFMPVYASWRGGRVTELVVNHRARQFGASKYGLNRVFKVLLDLMTVKFLGGYGTKPAYFFGGAGLGVIALGALAMMGVVIEKLTADVWQHKMTVIVLSTFLFTSGLMLLMMGLLSEQMIRIYHRQKDRKIYVVIEDLRPADDPVDHLALSLKADTTAEEA